MFIAQLGILAEQNNLDITTTTLHNCENSEVGRVTHVTASPKADFYTKSK